MARPYGDYVLNVFGNRQSQRTDLDPRQQRRRVPASPHPLQLSIFKTQPSEDVCGLGLLQF